MKLKVTRKTSKVVGAFTKKQWIIADTEHYGSAQDWNPENYTITAYEGDEIVGNLEMHIKVGVAEIDTLIVADGEQGHGVGTKLLTQAEALAKKHNAHKLYLFTGKGWKAEAFYKKFGMTPMTVLENHFAHKDFVQYIKFI